MMTNVIPDLPKNVRIVNKPQNVEHFNNRGKWNRVIETLKVIDNTKAIEMDVDDISKSRINNIKTSIKQAAKRMKLSERIKFALKDSVLFIWTNK